MTNGELTCECGDCTKCEGRSPCVDIAESGTYSHWLSLVSENNAKVVAFDNRRWDCTCSNCNELVGTWTCSGFYSSKPIDVTSVSGEKSNACATCVSTVCFAGTNKGGCGAVDIDNFLRECSDEFAAVSSEYDDLLTKVNANTNNINTNLGNINGNANDINGNTGNIATNLASINSNNNLIKDNSATIVNLENRVDDIGTFSGAQFVGGSYINDGYSDYNKYLPVITFISFIMNIILIIWTCSISRQVNKNIKDTKVRYYMESENEYDSNQPLKQ